MKAGAHGGGGIGVTESNNPLSSHADLPWLLQSSGGIRSSFSFTRPPWCLACTFVPRNYSDWLPISQNHRHSKIDLHAAKVILLSAESVRQRRFIDMQCKDQSIQRWVHRLRPIIRHTRPRTQSPSSPLPAPPTRSPCSPTAHVSACTTTCPRAGSWPDWIRA